jgi:hypothetical protein
MRFLPNPENINVAVVVIVALMGFAFQLFMNCKENMIFCFYSSWLRRLARSGKIGLYISKPLGTCIYCSTTWIGFIIGFLYGFSLVEIIMLGLSSSALAGLIQTTHFKLLNNE